MHQQNGKGSNIGEIEEKIYIVHDEIVNFGVSVLNYKEEHSYSTVLNRCNDIFTSLEKVYNLADTCNEFVPIEVLSYIDAGKNPDDFVRSFLEQCASENQFCRGKLDTFKEFADDLDSLIQSNFGEL